MPGPQNGRYAAEPLSGLTSLTEYDSGRTQYNASVQLAVDLGDTVKRIDGTEVPLLTPWLKDAANSTRKPARKAAKPKAEPKPAPSARAGKPALLDAAREGKADDLKLIKGVGPKLEGVLHGLGVFHFDQIASWKAEEVAWVDDNLEGFRGRVSRDNWVEQAIKLAAGEETEFAKRAKKDGMYD